MMKFKSKEILYAPQLNNMAYANRIAVEKGCEVIAQTIPDMSVHIKQGIINWKGQNKEIYETDININPSDINNDRIDLIIYNNNTNNIEYINGTPSTKPIQTPNYDIEDNYVLALIYVNADANIITNDDIISCVVNKALMTMNGINVVALDNENTKTVTHNLGSYPNVYVIQNTGVDKYIQLLDSDITDITHTSNNEFTINLVNNITGFLYYVGGTNIMTDNTKLSLDGSNRMQGQIKYPSFKTLDNYSVNVTTTNSVIVNGDSDIVNVLIQNVGEETVYIKTSSSINGISISPKSVFKYDGKDDLEAYTLNNSSDVRVAITKF